MDEGLPEIRFQEGDLVQTPDGSIGIVVGIYPVFDLGIADYYVKINDDIEIHPAADLHPVIAL